MRASSNRVLASRVARAAILFALALLPPVAAPFSFKPTSLEWAMWPEYCRARYAVGNVGNIREAAVYPKQSIQQWRNIIGDPTWNPLHHYCACVAYIHRYRMATTDQYRFYYLKSANSECTYTFERIPVTSSLYPTVSKDTLMVRALLGTR